MFLLCNFIHTSLRGPSGAVESLYAPIAITIQRGNTPISQPTASAHLG